MGAVTRYVVDGSARRAGDGDVLIGGSPLRLFRLGPSGRRVVDALWEGDPLPSGHESLTERLLDAALERNVVGRVWLPSFVALGAADIALSSVRVAQSARGLKFLCRGLSIVWEIGKTHICHAK